MPSGRLVHAEACGARFAVLVAGPSRGPLALCLHGFPDTPRTWRHLAPALAEAGRRVAMPYLRGFAPTEAPTDGASGAAALGADANALHAALGGDDRAMLVGHDWGAAAAYAACAAEPARWSRVVGASWPPVPAAIDLASPAQMRRSWYVFLFQLPQADALASDPAFLASLWAEWSPSYDGRTDALAAADALSGRDGARLALAHYRTLFAEPASDPALPARPTLYLHGADDGCIGSELADGLGARLAPGSEVHLIPGAGHFPQLEAPAAFNAAVMAFAGG